MTRGNIIILNGTSSSGKSSIVRALQEMLPEPYLEAGIDKFIFMLPKRYLIQPLWDDVLGRADRSGEVGNRLVSGMHHAIAALSDAGNHVIAEHVLVEPSWLAECATLFSERPAMLVGVRCPLEIAEAREKSRKDRTLGQAGKQFGIIHAHAVYDLEVDTSVATAEECARAIRVRLASRKPFDAFKQLYSRQMARNR